jgi:hypothetical protein
VAVKRERCCCTLKENPADIMVFGITKMIFFTD